jgi:hypothetical protein
MDNNDRLLNHSLSRSKGQFYHGPLSYTGYVNDTAYLYRGSPGFATSYDVSPTANLIRFNKKNYQQLSKQRHLKSFSIDSE